LLQRLLSLTPKAEPFYLGLQERRLNVLHHVRKIVALSEIYGTDKTARAIEDALTGVLWRDDSQVVQGTDQKTYGECYLTVVNVTELPSEPDRIPLFEQAWQDTVERFPELASGDSA
jgi:hypothetical protein